MPIDYCKFPSDRKAIYRSIRERSGGQCECTGECGLRAGIGGGIEPITGTFQRDDLVEPSKAARYWLTTRKNPVAPAMGTLAFEAEFVCTFTQFKSWSVVFFCRI